MRYVANAQSGTTYSILASDCGKLVTLNNASAVTLTFPTSYTSFPDGFIFKIQNLGVGTVTFAGGASGTLTTNQSADAVSTGSGWRILLGAGSGSGGTTPVSQGGTGITTISANGVIYGNGTSPVGVTTVGTVGQVLTSNGTGAAPTFQAVVGGSGGHVIQDATPTNLTQRANLQIVGSSVSGAIVTLTDNVGANKTVLQVGNDTAVLATRAQVVSGTDSFLSLTSSSGTAFTGNAVGNAITALTDGMPLRFRPNANCSGTVTIDADDTGALIAKKAFAVDGTTAASCTSGQSYILIFNSALDGANGGWVFPASGGGSSGTTAVASGGTGVVNLAANGVLYGNGTSPVGTTAVGTAGQTLTSNGAGVAPSFQTPAASPPKFSYWFMGQNVRLVAATTTECPISTVTSGTPITITCTVAHGFSTGARRYISGVGGVTEANNTTTSIWTITSTGANTFTLDGSTGTGTYTSGGTVAVPDGGCSYGVDPFTTLNNCNYYRFISAPVAQTISAFTVSLAGGYNQPASGPFLCRMRVAGVLSTLTVTVPAGSSGPGLGYAATGSSVTINALDPVQFYCENFATSGSLSPMLSAM